MESPDMPDGGAAGAGEGFHRTLDPTGSEFGFSSVLEFIQVYGWFILIAAIALYFIKSKFQSPRSIQPKNEGLQYDAETAYRRQQAMDEARKRLQEKYDSKAAVYEEQQKLKEQQKRQEKISDWDRHQEGKGYRSKAKPKENEEAASASPPAPKPKKRLRDSDYSPLMGDGGSCSYRPSRFSRGGGG